MEPGSGALIAQRTGQSVTIVNQPPEESRKMDSDLRSTKAMETAQLAPRTAWTWAGPPPQTVGTRASENGSVPPSPQCSGLRSSAGRRKHTPIFSKG